MRLWRQLKELGVGSLRDGVSLLPASESARAAFQSLAKNVAAEGDTARLLELPAQSDEVEAALVGWLDNPAHCPPKALGFDFDGATFTRVGDLVTFEVLLASFDLEQEPGLARLAALVHYLELGGLPMPEAAGFEAMLAGLRANRPDDDALLAASTPVLDALQRRFADALGM